MNILLLGSGGREHAIAWKLSRSPMLGNLFIAPGNAGTMKLGKNIPVSPNDFPAIRQLVLENKIDMVVVGPEDPLVRGIRDYFLADPLICSIPVIGPGKEASQLEGSKDFAKQFMKKYGIPTAEYRTFDLSTFHEGITFLEQLPPPYVLKADGLAAGKGVVICHHLVEAINEFTEMLQGSKFGEASSRVVVEEFLTGIELSAFVLTDGMTYKILPEAKDYKKIGEGDTGPNTGGMGSVSPVPFATGDFMQKVEERIIRPTMDGLIREGIDYRGFIFFGLMNRGGDPFVIEYNCRMGDPEAESVLPRLQNDLITLFQAVAGQTLETQKIDTDPRFTATVMLVSGGYPGHYEKGKVILNEDLVNGSLSLRSTNTVTITVLPLPVPVITGPTSLCAGAGYANYLTEAGNSGYSW
ncbi:MAG: phosphoribosylamine--glycine ligase, partial [bacterium]